LTIAILNRAIEIINRNKKTKSAAKPTPRKMEEVKKRRKSMNPEVDEMYDYFDNLDPNAWTDENQKAVVHEKCSQLFDRLGIRLDDEQGVFYCNLCPLPKVIVLASNTSPNGTILHHRAAHMENKEIYNIPLQNLLLSVCYKRCPSLINFKSVTSLQKPIKGIDIFSGFKCKLCGKISSSKGCMKSHSETHSVSPDGLFDPYKYHKIGRLSYAIEGITATESHGTISVNEETEETYPEPRDHEETYPEPHDHEEIYSEPPVDTDDPENKYPIIEDGHKCRVCGRVYVNFNSFQGHLFIAHGTSVNARSQLTIVPYRRIKNRCVEV
jgi:hypothetical protein